jgi:hypothetical protein
MHKTGTFRFPAQNGRQSYKWKKPCPAFIGQGTGGISMKLHTSDHPQFWRHIFCVTKSQKPF